MHTDVADKITCFGKMQRCVVFVQTNVLRPAIIKAVVTLTDTHISHCVTDADRSPEEAAAAAAETSPPVAEAAAEAALASW